MDGATMSPRPLHLFEGRDRKVLEEHFPQDTEVRGQLFELHLLFDFYGFCVDVISRVLAGLISVCYVLDYGAWLRMVTLWMVWTGTDGGRHSWSLISGRLVSVRILIAQ